MKTKRGRVYISQFVIFVTSDRLASKTQVMLSSAGNSGENVCVLSNTNYKALSGPFINTLSTFYSVYSNSNICILA